jgi:hypothetical protein
MGEVDPAMEEVTRLMIGDSAINGVDSDELVSSVPNIVGVKEEVVLTIQQYLGQDNKSPGGLVVTGSELGLRKLDVIHWVASTVCAAAVDLDVADSFYNGGGDLRALKDRLRKAMKNKGQAYCMAVCLKGLDSIYAYDDPDRVGSPPALLKAKMDYGRDLSRMISDLLYVEDSIRVFAVASDSSVLPHSMSDPDVLPYRVQLDNPKKGKRREIIIETLAGLSWDSFYSGDQEVFDVLSGQDGIDLLVADFKGADYYQIVRHITDSATDLATKNATDGRFKITPLDIYNDIFGRH